MPGKKRLGICYSGQPRDIDHTHENHHARLIIPNLDEFDIDIFAHIWLPPNSEGGGTASEIRSLIAECWNPTEIVYEEGRSFDTGRLVPDPRFPWPIDNSISMFFSMWRSFGVLSDYAARHSLRYDCVVRMRSDCYFKGPLGKLADYDLSGLNVYEWLEPKPHLDYAVHDHFGFGDFDVMKIYNDVYPHVFEICEAGAAVNPEHILGFHLRTHNVVVNGHPWDICLWKQKERPPTYQRFIKRTRRSLRKFIKRTRRSLRKFIKRTRRSLRKRIVKIPELIGWRTP